MNEEALSASSAHLALCRQSDDDDGSVPRYGEAAGVENHPQITDFVPRRYRSIAVVAVAGLISTAAVVAIDRLVAPVATRYGVGLAAPLALSAPGNLSAWLSATLLLLAAALSWLIYSLRRHRIDDYRGRYRVWLAAAVTCLAVSVDSVTLLHQLLAAVVAYHTGWTALPEHAIWWLALGGPPLAWIGLRAWLDARESRLAALSLATAILSYAAGLATALFQPSTPGLEARAVVASAAVLLGHWLVVVGLIAYCRFVVLDAQGLIAVRRRPPKLVLDTAQENSDMGQRPSETARGIADRQTNNARSSTPRFDPSQWTDGSEPEPGDFDDSDPRNRKLSKAERKRLRKLKARDRAA